jgi:hypothetical protein
MISAVIDPAFPIELGEERFDPARLLAALVIGGVALMWDP